ncbi:MAG: hypothetical protein Q8L36_01320 [bacterium]|nr:hypothetical protein [bacterium]
MEETRSFFAKLLDICQPLKDVLNFLGLIKKHRQRFHLGWVRSDRSIGDLLDFLKEKGFKSGFWAWQDSDQELSLRKLVDRIYQYHLRIFRDGEVRGHYEKTPEDSPVAHFMEWGLENRRNDFLAILEDWLVHQPEDQELISWEERNNASLVRKN